MIVGHDFAGVTYYSCPECEACPCPQHRSEHAITCSHRIPESWFGEDCQRMGEGRFMICSVCRFPPCHWHKMIGDQDE